MVLNWDEGEEVGRTKKKWEHNLHGASTGLWKVRKSYRLLQAFLTSYHW